MPLVKHTPMALEIDSCDLPNSVTTDAVGSVVTGPCPHEARAGHQRHGRRRGPSHAVGQPACSHGFDGPDRVTSWEIAEVPRTGEEDRRWDGARG
jgi:hypothetical protein